MARSSAAVERWCRSAGVEPSARTSEALARGVGLPSGQVWRMVMGERWPRGPTVFTLARALRVEPGAVLEACRLAVEDRQRRLDVERARLEAEAATD